MIKGEDVVRANLSTCFRGSALYLWLNTLSQDEKDAMIQLPTMLKRTITRLQEDRCRPRLISLPSKHIQ